MPRDTTQYVISGTTTYRLSSRKILKRWGGNRQNIEKSNRARFIPDEGKLFCQVDQSGAEALIVAHCMPRTNKLRQLFDNGIKIHNYLGCVFTEHWKKQFPMVEEFLSIPIPEVKKHPDWSRFIGAVAKSDENPPATRYYYHYKQTGHSYNYGCQPPAFVGNILLKSEGKVRLTLAQGQRYYEGYHKFLPELEGYYWQWVARQYEKDGILRNLFGFPIHITTKVFETNYKEIYDKIPQSTVGCITNIAYTNLQNYIEDNRLREWDVVQNNHDSYLGQAPGHMEIVTENGKDKVILHGEIATLKDKMLEFMQMQLTSPFGEIFRMRAEAQVGGNWCPRSEKKNDDGSITVKNENGLRELK